MIKVFKTKLDDVLLFQLDHFEDHRGTYTSVYNKEDYTTAIKKELNKDVEFVEDDYVFSPKNVLRGIHGDDRTWKLITCMLGRIYVVVVNCDEKSDNFGKWESFVLSKENGKQILIPPKYGNSYLVLSDEAIFHYKQSCYYRGMENQFTYKYNDPRFKIWWPIKNPILSQRDETEK
ncbi:MAG: dTDP-4-dehydrorhamnose 3,5-epimerase [Patescibacteria group bacterium]